MKRLIYKTCFAILLSVFAYNTQAQDTLYHTNEIRDTVYYVFEKGELPREDAAKLIITLMLEYETECYNDSIKVVTHECPDGMPGCLVYHTWYKTVRKEPTFKDFVKWIREKYCNK